MDNPRAEALNERLFTEMVGGISLLVVYIGHRLALFKEMAGSGSVSVSQLARRTRLSERYVREWLFAAAASEYVETDAHGETFTLSEEHAAVLADEESPFFLGAYPGMLQGLSLAIDPLLEAFKSGGGVRYEHYGNHFREGISLTGKPMFQHEYAQKWIPAMPEIHALLKHGARVADVGCGDGWSSVYLAKHFEQVTVDGIDIDEASIAAARCNAERLGVSDRVQFHACDIEKFRVEAPYDLVTSFECLHDLPYPVQALSRMRAITKPDATVFIADMAGGESFADNNGNPMGRFFYNVSVLHCLPQALVFPESVATGTAMSEREVRLYAREAGYSSVSILDIENMFYRFYQLQS